MCRTRSPLVDRGQQLLLQVDHHQHGALRDRAAPRAAFTLMARPRVGSRPRRATAAWSSSRWPVKKWSLPGTTTSVLGSGSGSTRARMAARRRTRRSRPARRGAAARTRRGRTCRSRIADREAEREQRAHARRRRSPPAAPSTEPNEKPPRTSGSPGKRRAHLVERGRARRPARRARRRACPRCAHAAEVEAQRRQRRAPAAALAARNTDLEVHDPAVQRVRVADDGGGRRRAVGVHQDRLEASRGAGDVEGLVLRHAGILCPAGGNETRGYARRGASWCARGGGVFSFGLVHDDLARAEAARLADGGLQQQLVDAVR